MNRCLLLCTFLLFCFSTLAQTGFLFVKKGGKKKRTWSEGDQIHLVLQNGYHEKGMITLLRNDTIFVNGDPVPRANVESVILDERKKPPFPVDAKTFALITGGAGLAAIGLSLNNVNKPGKAIMIASVIAYGPLLVKFLTSRLMYALYRKKFTIGRKYRLQVLDFYLPQRKGF